MAHARSSFGFTKSGVARTKLHCVTVRCEHIEIERHINGDTRRAYDVYGDTRKKLLAISERPLCQVSFVNTRHGVAGLLNDWIFYKRAVSGGFSAVARTTRLCERMAS